MMADLGAAEALKHGTYVVSWLNTLIVAPPLIVEADEIDEGVTNIDSSLDVNDKGIKT